MKSNKIKYLEEVLFNSYLIKLNGKIIYKKINENEVKFVKCNVENYAKLHIKEILKQLFKPAINYESKYLECDKCQKTKYNFEEFIYLDLINNKGFCEKCFENLEINKI